MEQSDSQRHLGYGKEYDFNGEKYMVYPLGLEYYGHTLRILNEMRKKFGDKSPKPEEMFALMAENRQVCQDISEMVNETVKDIFKDKEFESDEEAQKAAKSFSTKNMFYLMSAVIEQNMPQMNKEDLSKAQKIAQRQRLHDESVKSNKKSD